MVASLPTIFHITHYKSGSQWILQVLTECAPDRIVHPSHKLSQFYVDPLAPGAIYPTIYVPYFSFQKVLYPSLPFGIQTFRSSLRMDPEVKNWYHFVLRKMPVIKFVVIRDLRDTLISLYFSLKVSHTLMSDQMVAGRKLLNELDFETGFLQIMEPRGENQARIQRSWLPVCERGDALLVHYENLLVDELSQFEKIVEYCELDIPRTRLREIIAKNSFVTRTGRRPGEEDTSSHYRKGISGDWKNYFTDRIKVEFKKYFGQLLIETGYEKDLAW